MKKYFTKYCPVEGEIKEGDVYLQNLIGIGFPNEIRIYSGGKLDSRDKKVKLFLCSRDVKQGDKVRHLFNPQFEVEYNPEYDKNNYFKVIGEISPDAKWIKEGDEFDENEVKLYPIECPDLEWISGREELGYTLGIKIKGPCGNFH